MRPFKWNDWNMAKVAAHGLSPAEVEAAFGRIVHTAARPDGSMRTRAALASGRLIWVIWRYDREGGDIPDVFGVTPDPAIFVITAY